MRRSTRLDLAPDLSARPRRVWRQQYTAALDGRASAGTYVIFPTLRPFQQPAPVPSVRLWTQTAVTQALGNDANATIYDDPDPLGARRRRHVPAELQLPARRSKDWFPPSTSAPSASARAASASSSAISQLQPGLDYSIDYDIGTVTLNDAQSLFAVDRMRRFAPPGSRSRVPDRAHERVRPERALWPGPPRRAQLRGTVPVRKNRSCRGRSSASEPGAILLGGTSAVSISAATASIARSQGFPGLAREHAVRGHAHGRAALSVPNPNTRNAAYLDDFEATDESQLRSVTADAGGSAHGRESPSDAHRIGVAFTLDADTAAPGLAARLLQRTSGCGGSCDPAGNRSANSSGRTGLPEPALLADLRRHGANPSADAGARSRRCCPRRAAT